MAEVLIENVWTAAGDYGWSHPTGWTIGRYVVNGTPRFLLWQGQKVVDRFESFDEAVKHHASKI